MTNRTLAKRCVSIPLVFLLLQPQGANAFSNSDIAEALAYSGCTWAMFLESSEYGLETTVGTTIGMGLNLRIIDEGLSVPGIEKIDTPRVRLGYNHVLQSWSTAGVLSTKWKSLESSYEKGMQAGIRKWDSGSTLGVSKNAAEAIAGSKITALCRVAEIGVKKKATKAKLTTKKYVIKVTGSYLPPLPK
jgi:hypothetical protein